MPRNLCRAASRLAVLASLALASGGCSYQLDSLFSKYADKTAVDQTGSVSEGSAAAAASANASEMLDGDLAYARAAATEVLARGGAGSSLPWENPQTGARGTVTPIATAYTQSGLTCHDFLASYLREGTGESWLQGEACRIHQGKWEVRSLKPWKKSS